MPVYQRCAVIGAKALNEKEKGYHFSQILFFFITIGYIYTAMKVAAISSFHIFCIIT